MSHMDVFWLKMVLFSHLAAVGKVKPFKLSNKSLCCSFWVKLRHILTTAKGKFRFEILHLSHKLYTGVWDSLQIFFKCIFVTCYHKMSVKSSHFRNFCPIIRGLSDFQRQKMITADNLQVPIIWGVWSLTFGIPNSEALPSMTILIWIFCFGALTILTGDYFVLRINKIIYSKQKKKLVFYSF